MYNRPHCRNWMPLLTQQLRLRNVIKILGENIECCRNNQCKLYYTLHHSLDDDPIYTSDLVILNQSGTANWSEICFDFMNWQPPPCRSICVKVWRRHCSTIIVDDEPVLEDDSLRIAAKQKDIIKNMDNNDKTLFTWGVSFSGLVLISKRRSYKSFNNKFQPNTLIFQIHGSFFTSINKLIIQIDKRNENLLQNSLNYSSKLPINRSHDSFKNISVNTNLKKNSDLYTYSSEDSLLNLRNCDTSRRSIENINNIPSSGNLSSSLGVESVENSSNKWERKLTNEDKTHSKNISGINIANQSEDILQNDKNLIEKLNNLKIHFSTVKINKNNVRMSYKLDKLLQVQKEQRTTKLCQKDIKEISEHICLRSVSCITAEELSNIKPGAIYHNYNKTKNTHSMGRTLNRLLFQDTEIKPEDLLKAKELKKQIENSKFRLQILREEKNRLLSNFRQLEKKLSELSDRNVEAGSWLMSRYRTLSKEKENLTKEKLDIVNKQENYSKILTKLRQVKYQFCSELREIFQIEKKTSTKYTICKIFLPNTDELMDANRQQDSIFVVVPISLSSALGYVAHVVQMCSVFLDIPLRNPIKFEGSRSKIYDSFKELPTPGNINREFPLYTRTYPPPKSVLNAITLLNQNIVQLIYQYYNVELRNSRATLENLIILLNGPSALGNFVLQLPNLDNQQENVYSNSRTSLTPSSTDSNYIQIASGIADKQIDVVDYILHNSSPTNISDGQISRSVGSYNDENFSATNRQKIYNSEPSLANTKKSSFSRITDGEEF